ncbi:MAG TPA: hypothetical protein VHC97_09950 [Thermoanaerobaculia bacterium]|jgi:hypothetical protein|nr:hypothetical protein [Thermoanaerobaculia bacterium]
MTNSSRPREITLRVYQVGFGDCFLLTFHYDAPETDRHLLIDFGSTEKPDGVASRKDMLQQVAEDISRRCGGQLHAVIATHRHADHINGFATTKDEKGPGDIIRRCRPDLVLQPWTEDPEAPENPLTERLKTLHAFSWNLREDLQRLQRIKGYSAGVMRDLQRFAANNAGSREPSNLSAIENLQTMGQQPPAYLSYGQAPGLNLPGVNAYVLGPPTLAQWPDILKERSSHPDEFWQLLQTSSPIAEGSAPLFGDIPATLASQWAPQNARWLIRRLSSLRGEQLLDLVRVLDDVLNNTSLILLFEVGDQKLLFPGDAQWENWSYALHHPQDQARNEALLRGATLYKVGHHGSRNATPKSLWNLIQSNNLLSVLSTKPDRHGDVENKTEVPRTTLVRELKKNSQLFSTQDMGWGVSRDGEPPSKAFTITPQYPKSPRITLKSAKSAAPPS